MPLPIALFPDGKLPQRWRWTMPAYIVVSALVLAEFCWQDITGVLARHIRIDATGELAILGIRRTTR